MIKQIVRISFLVVALSGLVVAQDAPAVRVILKASAAAYSVGDPIPVELTVEPVDGRVMEFSEEFFANLKDKFVISNPRNQLVRSMSEFHYSISSPPKWLPTTKQRPYTLRFDLSELYPEPHDVQYPHDLGEPGTYRIRYKGEISLRIVKSPAVSWRGQIESSEMAISVAVPSEQESRQAADRLINPSTLETDKLRALNKAKYLNPDQRMAVFRHAVKSSNETIQVRALRLLGREQSSQTVEILKGALAANSPLVRSEAVASLGKNGSPEAVELIKEEARSRKERSYRAAVVVLGEIGDESALPILESIATTDQTDWVRERARESIEKIRRRNL